MIFPPNFSIFTIIGNIDYSVKVFGLSDEVPYFDGIESARISLAKAKSLILPSAFPRQSCITKTLTWATKCFIDFFIYVFFMLDK